MKIFIPHTVRIRLQDAAQVSIVGDFNNWHTSAHPLVEAAPGLWERIIDLPAGKHRYAFFVLNDPATAQGSIRSRVIANNSILYVAENGDPAITIIPHPALAIEPPSTSATDRLPITYNTNPVPDLPSSRLITAA